MEKAKQIRNRVAVVLVEDEKILLIQHEKNGKRYWVLPGGGVEFGETIADAAKRELMEETGLEIEPGELLFVLESIPPDQHRHVINYYITGKRTGGTMQVGDEEILVDLQWHQLEDVPHLLMYPDTAKELMELFQTGTVQDQLPGNRWL